MSNTGQIGSAITGAIVGYVSTGGSYTGAAYGFQAGLLAGTLIFPTQLPTTYGPRVEDLQTTNAELGVPIPRVYGTIAVPGIVMYVGCAAEVATETTIGGKGAPEQSQVAYTYFQTLAVAFSEGPIDGLMRVWENGELKYDNRVQQDGEDDATYVARVDLSSEYAATFTLYLGDEFQDADPTLEGEVGVGNVPGFRGLAYIVYPNRQLTDAQARRHPIFRFEVYTAVSVGREVLAPTIITGAFTTWQSDMIAVDWVRNRYYATDLVGDDGLRVYSIIDNVELEQKSFADILGGVTGMVGTTVSVGLDGFVYISGFPSLHICQYFRVDPTTLESVFSQQYSDSTSDAAAVGSPATAFIRQYGTSKTTDYFLLGSLFGYVTLMSCEFVGIHQYISTGHDTVLPCRGKRTGVVSYGFWFAFTPALSGSGPSIDIYRVKAFETYDVMSFVWVPTFELVLWHSIAPSDIDATWTRFSDFGGLVFDETDDTFIFGVKGANGGASALNSDTLIKWNPDTFEFVWMTAHGAIQIVNVTDQHSSSRLRGAEYVLTQGVAHFRFVDTRTGEVRDEDWLGDLSNVLFGQFVYDSGLNAAIGYVIGQGPSVIYFDRRIAGPVSIADIIRDVWDLSDGDVADIDVADLEDKYVEGYALGRPMPGRGAIDALRPLGPFDGVESQGVLHFPVRGKPIVATLTADEMGIYEDISKPGPAITCQEVQDVEMPRRVRVKYIAPSRDYEPGEQLSPVRFTSSTVNERDVEIPAAITDTRAAVTAELLWSEAWLARWLYETSVDVEHLALDPADCIGMPFEGRIYRARIISIDDSANGLLRRLQLVRDDDGTYTSLQVADVPARIITTVISYGLTGLVLLDLPPLLDAHDDPGIYAAMYSLEPAKVWQGAVVYRSIDAGATYSSLASTTTQATVGTLGADLPSGATTIWDDANTITVNILSGTLESVTEDDLLSNRLNALAIGAAGRWEIVQFQVATQVSATQWTLSRLLRGRRATEHNVGLGVAGDFVVGLANVIRLPLQIADIGLAKVYKAVTIGTAVNDASPQTFTGNGEALECFSPVSIEATRDGSNNITLTWIRRGRIGYELPDGSDIPLSEETESYSVDVIDTGSPEAVLRTIASATQTAAYTAAQQTADGLTPGDPVTVDVYQISATVGRGHAGRATV